MENYFQNIFIEEKEWVKENPYNKSLIEATEQFNKYFHKNLKNKSNLQGMLCYKYDEKASRLHIDFFILKGFEFSYTLFKTWQNIGEDMHIFVEYKECGKFVPKKNFESYLVNEIFGSKRFSTIISQLTSF